MKKLLALLLAIVMILCLTACGSEEDDDDDDGGKKSVKTEEIESAEDLVGTWTLRTPLDVMEESESGASAMAGMSKLRDAGFDLDYIEYEVTFTEDGKLITDGASAQEAQIGMMKDLVKWLKKGNNFYTYYEAVFGVDKDEVDSQLESSGMTKADALEMMEKQIESGMEQTGSIEDQVSYYAYEDGKLYTWEKGEEKSDRYFTIGKSGKTIVILECVE